MHRRRKRSVQIISNFYYMGKHLDFCSGMPLLLDNLRRVFLSKLRERNVLKKLSNQFQLMGNLLKVTGANFFPPRKPECTRNHPPPNNILFIQNLPHEATSMMLQVRFQQYPGFRGVRMIEAKPGIAFVEFEDDVQSSTAMQALQGFKITPQNPMAVTYAKK